MIQNLIQLGGFLGHRYPVERLAFNGSHLASGAHKEVKIWARVSNGEFCLMRLVCLAHFLSS